MTTRLSDLERWEAKVSKSDYCWLWTGSLIKGYGKFRVGGRLLSAHRWSFERFVGPIPVGLTIDHLCHTRVAEECLPPTECMHRRCVNPDHLEPVVHRVNLLRGNTLAAANLEKARCPSGHEYTSENTYIDRRGSRYCKACKRHWTRLAQAKRRAVA